MLSADTDPNARWSAEREPIRSSWRWPDFPGIGVAKAGTSWLYTNLFGHPAIWMPPFKEMQYFNGLHVPGHGDWIREYRLGQVVGAIIDQTRGKAADKIDFKQIQQLIEFVGDPPNDEWYGKIFGRAPADRLCGEITPEYGVLPDAGIAPLLQFNPRMKFIPNAVAPNPPIPTYTK